MTKANGNISVCVQEANAFYYMAKYIIDADQDFPFSISIYPVIVNLAFCCELYFKALMIYRSPNNEFDTGHSLIDLFGKLSEYDKHEIESKCGSILKTRSFTETMNELDNAFINWRYAFESERDSHIRLHELISFANTIHLYCNSVIKPTSTTRTPSARETPSRHPYPISSEGASNAPPHHLD